ncbi:MAG: helix-turn-helix transcriptional regulator [Armatimonadota bacterium]
MTDNIKVRLGNRVRALRLAAGLSQERFALECGLDRTYISGVERGQRNVSLVNLEKIARGLRMPLDRLLEGL